MKPSFLLTAVLLSILTKTASGQPSLAWSRLANLPDSLGWAGMYAGVSHGVLLCAGGANFPNGAPWEGGKKKWYDTIYRIETGGKWETCAETLPVPAAYGVSVSWRNQLIVVGGSNQDGHLSIVRGYEWDGQKIRTTPFPNLPIPLANMAGALVDDLLVVAGGSRSSNGPAERICYGLDLNNRSTGWFSIDPWPGPGRVLPVCSVYKHQFYLFSGETTGTSAAGKPFRQILQDGYRLSLSMVNGKWHGSWQKLTPMPRGASAAGTPLPVLDNGCFLLWGGVDAVTALYTTPTTHPGIPQSALLYDPETDTWAQAPAQKTYEARVTLPVVCWNNQWLYISGEIKPGIRTNTVVTVH